MNRLSLPLLLSLVIQVYAQSPSPNGRVVGDCQFYVWADDSFEMFINGQPVWDASDYQNVVQKSIPISRGDVLTISVTDKQGGIGGRFAILIINDDKVLASTQDFRYTVNPPPQFTTSASMQNLRVPQFEPSLKSFGLGPDKQPKMAWTQKSDRKFGTVHFKYVVP